ncbi:MAG: hypothetical protein AAGN15_10500 [Cyanobacteria bacterium J06581_3]
MHAVKYITPPAYYGTVEADRLSTGLRWRINEIERGGINGDALTFANGHSKVGSTYRFNL